MLWVSQLHWPEPMMDSGAEPPAEAAPPASAPSMDWPPDALRVDVRSYAEFMAGHLPGAHSMPLPRLGEIMALQHWPMETPLLVYCATGARAELAVAELRRLGWARAYYGGGALELSGRLHEPLLRGM
ncbi:rhodanese-like domain-containing protein [Roseateles flavus]|uniref:Rhodanese-like domain-containing protein n=1 Tax=Roseateles flavus TaxID=3149041 RepID=A0ABV0GL69_9BURK